MGFPKGESNKFVYDGAVGKHLWYDGTPHPWEFKRVWHLEPSLSDDDAVYAGVAPLLIFTPPNVPHAFYSEVDTEGHVLTVRQEMVRAWCKDVPAFRTDALLRSAAFLQIADLPEPVQQEYQPLVQLMQLVQAEYVRDANGRSVLLQALGKSAFVHIGRMLLGRQSDQAQRPERSEDLRHFLRFCDLVEAHFRDHLTLADYAGQLLITEARLNDICRRMAERSSKEIVHERLLQEARRLLRFSAVPVAEICYQLGFSDPGYFSRFFTRRAGMPPSEFRAQRQA